MDGKLKGYEGRNSKPAETGHVRHLRNLDRSQCVVHNSSNTQTYKHHLHLTVLYHLMCLSASFHLMCLSSFSISIVVHPFAVIVCH